MKYELAKQLKEAGFLQDGEGCMLPLVPLYDDGINSPPQPDKVYAPTLEELIEACPQTYSAYGSDDYVFALNVFDKKWIAGYEKYESFTVDGEGETATEAVAMLWLALHKPATKPH